MKLNITAFGEIVWDCFGDTETLGGAPLNFAYYCALNGCESAIIGAIGRDRRGAKAREKIREIGISDAALADSDYPTGVVEVSKGADGLPQYDILKSRAWDFIEATPAAAETAKNCDAFCFGTLSQRSRISRDTLFKLIALLRRDCLKVFDVNLRQNYYDARIVGDSLKSADIVKLNETELPEINALIGGEPSENFGDMANAVFEKFPVKIIICTLGERGYSIFRRGEPTVNGLPIPVKVADTVGAGDAFTAGFVSALLGGGTVESAATNAAKCAAVACSRRGAIQ